MKEKSKTENKSWNQKLESKTGIKNRKQKPRTKELKKTKRI
ncbi:MAG: hypothetical protein AB3K77_14890 [Methanosarcinaceae archaeon]